MAGLAELSVDKEKASLVVVRFQRAVVELYTRSRLGLTKRTVGHYDAHVRQAVGVHLWEPYGLGSIWFFDLESSGRHPGRFDRLAVNANLDRSRRGQAPPLAVQASPKSPLVPFEARGVFAYTAVQLDEPVDLEACQGEVRFYVVRAKEPAGP